METSKLPDHALLTDPRWSEAGDRLLLFKKRVYVAKHSGIRDEILHRNYDDPHAGHFGYAKTLTLLKRKY